MSKSTHLFFSCGKSIFPLPKYCIMCLISCITHFSFHLNVHSLLLYILLFALSQLSTVYAANTHIASIVRSYVTPQPSLLLHLLYLKLWYGKLMTSDQTEALYSRTVMLCLSVGISFLLSVLLGSTLSFSR